MALVPFAKRTRRIVGESGLFGDISILERLEDFRKRIVRALLAVAGGALVGFALIDRLVAFLLQPTRRALPGGTRLIYTEPGEAFGLYVQVALISGVVFAMPFIMYQLWRLIAPLVPPAARRFAIPFVGFTTLGFVAGAAFTHYIAFPYTIFLAKLGLITAGFLWRSFKYAFLLIFVAAAVITPTGDMVTQTIFAAPMVALYLLSIGIAWVFGRVAPVQPTHGDS
jgi:sec-independent protein translocase protein TatC